MANITEIVLRNSIGCELGRQPVKVDDDGELNLAAEVNHDFNLRSMVTVLRAGDSITIEERWSEDA